MISARVGIMAAFSVLFSVAIISPGCGDSRTDKTQVTNIDGKKFNRPQAETEYRQIQMELRLAKADELYLVLDTKDRKLELRMKDAVVWSYPMNFAPEDSTNVREFIKRFRGKKNNLVRRLVDKHLFSASEKTPDSVLAIVGEAVRVDPSHLQRDIPQRFQLSWGDGLILEVRTDVSGKSVSVLQNAITELRQVISQPFGEVTIVLKIDPTEALTLYRAVSPGMPTLIDPT